MSFRTSSDDPGGTRTVAFVVNDGIADSAAVTRNVVLTPENDAPVISVPGSQTAREDTPLVFSPGTGNQIAIADVDAGANPVRLSLLATNGTLNLLQTTGLTFVGGADGTAGMSFTGTVADINAALSGLRFLAAADYVGPADVQILVDDLGNTGGGPLGASRTVLINVTSVHDAPAGTNATVTTSEETPYVFSVVDFGFTDLKDSPGDAFQAVRIATLPGGGTLTNSGSPVTSGDFVNVADILAGELVYTPFANASGAGYATLGFQVQDSGGTADGGADLDSLVRTLTIDVAAVNDPPVNVVPGSQSTPLGTPLTFSSANGNAFTVSDIDENGGGLGVTLTTTNGTLTLATTAGLISVTGNATGSVSFSGSPDDINDALDGLVFSPNAGFFGAGSLQIVTDDLGNTGSPGPLQAMDSIAIDVTYSAPSVNTNPTGSLSYVENDPPTAVDNALSVGAGTLGALTGASVEITGNYVNGEDLLDYSAALLPGGVSAVWNASVGTLTFTGTATLAQYEALLRSVTYENLSENPDTAPRVVTFRLDDGISTVTDNRQIDLTSVNDAPDGLTLSNGSLDENVDTSGGYGVGMLSASDVDVGDSHTYSIVGGSDGSLFSIAGDQLLLDDGVLDYEWQASYEVVVRATDSGDLTFDETFIIGVNDIATAIAAGQMFGVGELAGNSGPVGTVATSGDVAVSFSIVSGDPLGAFSIDANGGITVDDNSALDFETTPSYTLIVEANDGTSVSAKTLTILVTDAGASVPAGQTLAVSEAAANGDPLGAVVTAGDVPVSFAITAGNGGGVFTIDSFGDITVLDASGIDYESATSFTLTIQVSDGTSAVLQDVTIDVIDANDTAPVVIAGQVFAVAENAGNGTAMGTPLATDPDTVGSLQGWTIVSGNTDAIFSIDSVTGELTVADNGNLDFETTSSYVLGIQVTDGLNASAVQTITVDVIDVSDNAVGPVGDADAGTDSVVEGAAAGTPVGLTAIAADIDLGDTVTYTLDDDAGGRFTIDALSGVVTVANGSLLDREAAASHDIVVRAQSSDGSSGVALFTISIDDADEYDVTPIADLDAVADGVVENAPVGTLVGITASASDPDSTTNQITYSLDDNAGGRFAIDNLTGVVTIAGAIDYETATNHDIIVRARSADGSWETRLFTIAVSDVSDSPVGAVNDLDATSNEVPEDAVAGTAVGVTAVGTDPDVADTVGYSLDDDAGGRFAIDALTGVVSVAGVLDHETAADHAIVVRATSSDASFSIATFTISVEDVNEPPAISAIADQAISEDGTTGPLTLHHLRPGDCAGFADRGGQLQQRCADPQRQPGPGRQRRDPHHHRHARRPTPTARP